MFVALGISFVNRKKKTWLIVVYTITPKLGSPRLDATTDDVIKEPAPPYLSASYPGYRNFYSHGWKMAVGPPSSISTFWEGERNMRGQRVNSIILERPFRVVWEWNSSQGTPTYISLHGVWLLWAPLAAEVDRNWNIWLFSLDSRGGQGRHWSGCFETNYSLGSISFFSYFI